MYRVYTPPFEANDKLLGGVNPLKNSIIVKILIPSNPVSFFRFYHFTILPIEKCLVNRYT